MIKALNTIKGDNVESKIRRKKYNRSHLNKTESQESVNSSSSSTFQFLLVFFIS